MKITTIEDVELEVNMLASGNISIMTSLAGNGEAATLNKIEVQQLIDELQTLVTEMS